MEIRSQIQLIKTVRFGCAPSQLPNTGVYPQPGAPPASVCVEAEAALAELCVHPLLDAAAAPLIGRRSP